MCSPNEQSIFQAYYWRLIMSENLCHRSESLSSVWICVTRLNLCHHCEHMPPVWIYAISVHLSPRCHPYSTYSTLEYSTINIPPLSQTSRLELSKSKSVKMGGGIGSRLRMLRHLRPAATRPPRCTRKMFLLIRTALCPHAHVTFTWRPLAANVDSATNCKCHRANAYFTNKAVYVICLWQVGREVLFRVLPKQEGSTGDVLVRKCSSNLRYFQQRYPSAQGSAVLCLVHISVHKHISTSVLGCTLACLSERQVIPWQAEISHVNNENLCVTSEGYLFQYCHSIHRGEQ